ncbi:MAG: hypothetical protein AUI97_01475 [Crenarchaeota archaeon 13_1_40CM_3_52_17]|nr:MAG: hypothetical protein AUI97_01475 [Crenarchaeota archaeon 13_1_40CM_3_52_17]
MISPRINQVEHGQKQPKNSTKQLASEKTGFFHNGFYINQGKESLDHNGEKQARSNHLLSEAL